MWLWLMSTSYHILGPSHQEFCPANSNKIYIYIFVSQFLIILLTRNISVHTMTAHVLWHMVSVNVNWFYFQQKDILTKFVFCMKYHYCHSSMYAKLASTMTWLLWFPLNILHQYSLRMPNGAYKNGRHITWCYILDVQEVPRNMLIISSWFGYKPLLFDSCDVHIRIPQGYFTGTGAILWLPLHANQVILKDIMSIILLMLNLLLMNTISMGKCKKDVTPVR